MPFGPAIVAGVKFIYGHSALRWIYLMLIFTALSVRSYTFLLPAYAVHVVHADARGLGALMASSGIGAVVGALLIAAFNVRKRAKIWFAATMLMSIGVAVLGLTDTILLSALVLTFVGLGTQGFIGSSNIPYKRSRPTTCAAACFLVYSMIALGLVPGGAPLTERSRFSDLRLVFVCAGILSTAMGIWIYCAHPKLREA